MDGKAKEKPPRTSGKGCVSQGKRVAKEIPRLRLVVVECDSEESQRQTEERLLGLGIRCSLRML